MVLEKRVIGEVNIGDDVVCVECNLFSLWEEFVWVVVEFEFVNVMYRY